MTNTFELVRCTKKRGEIRLWSDRQRGDNATMGLLQSSFNEKILSVIQQNQIKLVRIDYFMFFFSRKICQLIYLSSASAGSLS